MRIVGGTLSGRIFAGPAGDRTRPTSERVREAVASAIESRGGFEDERVLDLFAGTGAMGFEALSRGARHAVLVDYDPRTIRGINQAARSLGLDKQCKIVSADLRRSAAVDELGAEPFGRIFADPPYSDIHCVAPLLERMLERGLLGPECIIVVEHARKNPPTLPESLQILSEPRYGDTAVVLATLPPPEDDR